MRKPQSGFTLIELVLYIALLSVFLNAAIVFSWQIIFGQNKSRISRSVSSSLQYIDQKFSYELSRSDQILSVSSTDLCVSMQEASRSPMRIYLDNQTIYMGWGGNGTDCSFVSSLFPLSSSQVRVTDLNFTSISTGSATHLMYAFSIEGNTTKQEWQTNKSIRSSVEVYR